MALILRRGLRLHDTETRLATTVQRSHISSLSPRSIWGHVRSIRAAPPYAEAFRFRSFLVGVPCALSSGIKKGADAPIFLFPGVLGASGGYLPLRWGSSMMSWSIMPCLMAR
ncbi:hypothetical protein, partial [Vibrio parahaemolyticus]|uniref:hypothetical protein n=1 Tax=Vibrio parahaemolyticus TaxID=670 RepID=UPI00146F6E69|nr:hypothetical protein [Vibrio parahaemolyticus]